MAKPHYKRKKPTGLKRPRSKPLRKCGARIVYADGTEELRTCNLEGSASFGLEEMEEWIQEEKNEKEISSVRCYAVQDPEWQKLRGKP